MKRFLRWLRLSGALVAASLVCLVLYFGGVLINGSYAYNFMVWNLFLAWVPLFFIAWLIAILKHKRWTSWQGITLSVLWLGFLPNSFYIVTDYIHLADTPRVDVLYDAVMLTSFTLTGLALGYLSLYLFHGQLARRLPAATANKVVGIVLFLCSVAIYLGRDLRWNTWDIFLNPAGILFDVSDRLINPRAHGQMFITILSFFLLLGMMYFLILSVVRAFHNQRPVAGRDHR